VAALLVALAAWTVSAAAPGRRDPDGAPGTGGSPVWTSLTGRDRAPAVDPDRVGAYVAALGGRPPARDVYVRASICPEIVATAGADCRSEPIPADIQRAVRRRLGPRVTFRTDPPFPARPDDPPVYVLGALTVVGDSARIGRATLCGSLCGEGVTLTLARRHGQWRVTGQTGPMWIS
jgi:hypothetical protein